MTEKFNRLFFAMKIAAPWPEHYPEGRLLREPNRLAKPQSSQIRSPVFGHPL
jgi:hypothetical protein